MLTLDQDMREFVWLYIDEANKANAFYMQQLSILNDKFDQYYLMFREKILDGNPEMELNSNLTGSGTDSLGYASSWSWPFIENYI